MKLYRLIEDIPSIKENYIKNLNIKSLSHNSKQCEKSGLFFCLSGGNFDGHDYVEEAKQNGAVAIVCERKIDTDLPQIIVEDSRLAMAIIAKRFNNNVADKLKIISVIGTNGKTTVCSILAHIMRACGKKVGIVGTNGVYFDNELKVPSSLTTPDPIELHYIFNQLYMFGIEYVIIEASAHAIELKKMHGIKNELGIFTNISNEHLDYFKTMEHYSAVKTSYFKPENMKASVVNIDDEYGKKICVEAGSRCFSYGIANPAHSFAIDIETSMKGSKFVVNTFDNIINIESVLVGDFNIYNTLAAITAAKVLGCSNDVIKDAIKNMKPVEGRFNIFEHKNNIKIIVDFAHTSDGFEKTLGIIKKLRQGKIITLFGCVDYADKEKREKMGEVADKYSDEIIITADNPNFTTVDEIAVDIKKGIKKCKVTVISNRKEAIEFAFKNLKTNDTLVLLGKGAETHQKIKGKNEKHSDIMVVKGLLKIN